MWKSLESLYLEIDVIVWQAFINRFTTNCHKFWNNFSRKSSKIFLQDLAITFMSFFRLVFLLLISYTEPLRKCLLLLWRLASSRLQLGALDQLMHKSCGKFWAWLTGSVCTERSGIRSEFFWARSGARSKNSGERERFSYTAPAFFGALSALQTKQERYKHCTAYRAGGLTNDTTFKKCM